MLGRPEPYPSIVMPGFERAGAVADPADVLVRYVRVEVEGTEHLVSAEELFQSAPPNQRPRMMARLDGLEGTASEWDFFDLSIERLGLAGRVGSVEVVLRSGRGEERSILLLERGDR